MSRFNASKDYYSILGADEDASQSEIYRLYKRLAVQHHPDRGGDEEEMKSLNEAYHVLGDETARRAYDVERRKNVEAEEENGEPFVWPYASPPAKVDVFTGQWVGAILFIAVGLVLALLVRFQWIWFLWPLAILAAFLVLVGLLMAHAAMRRVGSEQRRARAWLGVTLEVTFWAVVIGGGYGIYLIIS
ncbi:MAG TPA: DnaJ domain-containing protein [Pyrinomonadaceae bacterium]